MRPTEKGSQLQLVELRLQTLERIDKFLLVALHIWVAVHFVDQFQHSLHISDVRIEGTRRIDRVLQPINLGDHFLSGGLIIPETRL